MCTTLYYLKFGSTNPKSTCHCKLENLPVELVGDTYRGVWDIELGYGCCSHESLYSGKDVKNNCVNSENEYLEIKKFKYKYKHLTVYFDMHE